MKHNTTFIATVSLLLGMGVTLGLQGFAQQHEMKDSHKMAGAKMKSPSMQMHEAMMAPMKKMGKMTGDPDRDFASMMAEHHKSAVDMAKLELKYGKNAELKKMSKAIIKSQSEEIVILKKHAMMKH